MKIPTASASRVVTAVPRNAALFACFALASCAPTPSNVGQGGGANQGQGGGVNQGQGGGASQGQGGGVNQGQGGGASQGQGGGASQGQGGGANQGQGGGVSQGQGGGASQGQGGGANQGQGGGVNQGQGGGASQGQGGGVNQGQGGGASQGQGGGAAGFVIGGTISGLNVSGLTLNGGLAGVVMPDAGDTSFTLPNSLSGGAAYAVQISSLPLGKQCTVDNASGTVQGTSVTSVAVTCVGAWTWVSGQSTTSANGVYGVQGVPNSGNYPGARSSAASWVDATGTLWLFGGNGYPADGRAGVLNDLWTYSPTTGQWTWMKGGDTIGATGSYGTLLVPDAGNVPPARSDAQNWLDSQGRFWLFGGFRIGYDQEGRYYFSNYLNDLWSYSPGNNQWTWAGGTQGANVASIYGPQGLADAGSSPGGRAKGATWIDSQGNIWLFGGFGRPTGGELPFSDLWSFSPTATEWTWVGGKSEPNERPVYGELGASDAGNSPGARFSTATWTDGHGRLWLFGGRVPVVFNSAGFNDLWNYSTSTKQWTWVGGETTASARGVYGRKLAPDGGNYPRARYEASTWTDSTGKFWLFGGYDAPPGTDDYLNDLWHYSSGTNQWTWVGGAQAANQTGIYGVRGVPDAGNSPGARSSASSWADSQGRLWLFGGQGYAANGNADSLNDLWVYAP